MDKSEIMAVIGRVRLATRNRMILDLCDEAERLVLAPPVTAPIQPVTTKPRFDKVAYQRALMRERRAAAKAAKAG
jgi:hypothetical protein